MISPSANNSNNYGSNNQAQRTKSLPNIGHSFGERVDVNGSHEGNRQAAHPDGDHFALGYGSGGSGNNSHNGSVNQGYHYNNGHGGGHNAHAHGGHQGGAQSHNIDYLSTADTSDGEDIPVLEIDLSN